MTKPVGYGSPPDYTKWPKGKSGNPSGRKKGNRNFATDLADGCCQSNANRSPHDALQSWRMAA